MASFDLMKGIFGLLPTPYTEDLEIHTAELRAAAKFCCESGQHGIVWPVMVGEFYYLGESERIANLDAVLEETDGRLPVVFGCSGISVPQVLLYAGAAQRAGADAIIAMAPVKTNASVAMDMFRRLGDVYDGPIMLQNAGGVYVPLAGEQIAQLVEEIPQLQYIKEERTPGPRHIGEVVQLAGHRLKTIFGGTAGRVLPADLQRGANGCMPACEFGDLLAVVFERWWAGDEAGARDLHTRLLPLLNLEDHHFIRYILKRRGVITSLIERAPWPHALDEADKREISILLRAVEDDIDVYPFGPE